MDNPPSISGLFCSILYIEKFWGNCKSFFTVHDLIFKFRLFLTKPSETNIKFIFRQDFPDGHRIIRKFYPEGPVCRGEEMVDDESVNK